MGDLEELIRGELQAVSADVAPRPEWTTSVLVHLHHRHAAVRRAQLLVLVAVVALAATAIVLVGSSDAGRPQPAPRPEPPGGHRMVDIGGRALSLDCFGRSSSG